jgi:hypothetical protein
VILDSLEPIGPPQAGVRSYFTDSLIGQNFTDYDAVAEGNFL